MRVTVVNNLYINYDRNIKVLRVILWDQYS